MNLALQIITRVYASMLRLYPRGFREEFSSEMQTAFDDLAQESSKAGSFALLVVCFRELIDLPANLSREFWHEFRRKETQMPASQNSNSMPDIGEQTNPWEAIIGALPFVVFGVVGMLAKFDLFFQGEYVYLNDAYLELAFYVFVLIGFFFGLIRGVPSWTYSYLGWSLILLWMSHWFLGAVTGIEPNPWSWQIWSPLLSTIAVALILRRSLVPLFQLVKGVWRDWTLLSLAMYTFVGLMMLDYDENHSPYLMAFMLATTLAISATVWVFMKSTKPLHRFITLLSGFVAGMIINRISESTWDVAAYYGLPTQPPTPWYDSILDVIVMTGFWGVILLLPALVGFARSAVKSNNVP